ncbi:MAG: hypothetical protein LBL09_02295 [Oscillospiraceae bacterium]|jgi:hypothetical protein|nr:hypothetical protein [Oscillospiraceae bacterium]
MKQGRVIYAVITAIIFLAFASYMTVYVVNAVTSPFKTVEAIIYTVEETAALDGYFFRDELLIPSSSSAGVAEAQVKDGARVARGQNLVVTYSDAATMEKRKEILDAEYRIEQLSSAAGGESVGMSKLDASLSEEIYKLVYSAEKGEFTGVYSSGEKLKAYVLARDFAYSAEGKAEAAGAVEALRTELSALRSQVSGGVASVAAPASGYFSSYLDGYEQVLERSDADDINVAALENISKLRQTADRSAYCGKLVTSYEWRYAAVVPSEVAAGLEQGSRVTLRFTEDYIGDIRVTVQRIGEDEGGKRVVAFSCTTLMSDLINQRRQSAEILLGAYEGIRVPKEALRVGEDGNIGVYCLIAMQAKFIRVEQIYETETHYIVKYDVSQKDILRPGDEIIVSSKNLYDGKIIKE